MNVASFANNAVLIIAFQSAINWCADLTTPGMIPLPDITVDINGTPVVWSATHENYMYGANPHCLDKRGVYVLAGNSEEVHDAVCASLESEITPCPNNTRLIKNLCVAFVEGTYESSKCPYNYELDFEQALWNELIRSPVWVPAVRNFDYGIGEFVFEPYHTVLDATVMYFDSVEEKNCVVYNGGIYLSVSCDATYTRLCAYERLYDCQRHICSDIWNCKRASYTELKCVCFEPTCETFADFPEPFMLDSNKLFPAEEVKVGVLEQFMLDSNKLFSVEEATVGVFIDEVLRWNSTGLPVQYTIFQHYELDVFSNSDNIIWNQYGWRTSKGKSKFSLCQKHVEPPLPQIYLELDGSTIKINCTNCSGLVKQKSKHTLTCLTDSWKKHLFTVLLSSLHPYLHIYPIASGYYWCRGINSRNFTPIQSNRVLFQKDAAYTLEIRVSYQRNLDPTSSQYVYDEILVKLENVLKKQLPFEVSLKWTKTLGVNRRDLLAYYLVHICTENSDDSLEFYHEIKKNLDQVHSESVAILGFYDPTYCLETQEDSPDGMLTWNLTRASTAVESNELCLNSSGLPIFRSCNADFYSGARWQEFKKCIYTKADESNATRSLQELVNSDENSAVIVEKLCNITGSPVNFTSLDVLLISQVLYKVHEVEVDLEQTTEIISNTMFIRSDVLLSSQVAANATDRILYSFDKILTNSQFRYNQKLMQSSNVLVYLTDIEVTGYSGLALIEEQNQHFPVLLAQNSTLAEVAAIDNLVVALFVQDHKSRAAFTLFSSNALFNGYDGDFSAISKSVAALLPNEDEPHQLHIVFKTKADLAKRERYCSFWNYDLDTKGDWLRESKAELADLGTLTCTFNHTTHYALLLSDKRKPGSEILDLITLIESSFSLIGVLGILLTAALFKAWRRNRGNQILVHYALVSAVQITLIYAANKSQENYSRFTCTFVGAAMHYTVLAQFGWMLVMAYLLYKRYVQVFQSVEPWYQRNFPIICYSASAVPVAVLLIFFKSTFREGGIGFCYPKGMELAGAVFLPVTVIFGLNMFIFILILRELFCKKKIAQEHDSNLFLRLRLVVVLFFVLGITWSFGLLSQVFQSSLFDVLFCITAPIHGLVLFVFFVLMNANVRRMYWQLFKKFC